MSVFSNVRAACVASLVAVLMVSFTPAPTMADAYYSDLNMRERGVFSETEASLNEPSAMSEEESGPIDGVLQNQQHADVTETSHVDELKTDDLSVSFEGRLNEEDNAVLAEFLEESYQGLSDDSNQVTSNPTELTAEAVVDAEETTPELVSQGTVDSPALEPQSEQSINVYRLYNPNSGEHFYTTILHEAKKLVSLGWHWEGIAWAAPITGDAVFRLYNPNAGDHHYTLSVHERDWLVSLGWRYEGVAWKSDQKCRIVVWRQYNPNASQGNHHFTLSKNEKNHLVSLGWRNEGGAWYAAALKASNLDPFWVDSPSGRQWVQPDGNLARNRLVKPSEGAGC